jgi:hypothetical protein
MGFLRRWWWLLPVLLSLGAAAFVAWALVVPAPMSEAIGALVSDGLVEVETEPWLVFRPTADRATTGLILYPGGRVDPRAYAPAARQLASQGSLVIITPMPLNLAVLSPGRAGQVMAAFPDVQRWTVGGHSLGGAMAARFALQQPGAVQGLVLWAAYPGSSDDLSGQDLVVTSIYGTHDGLATPDKIVASRALLPPGTHWVPIEGGNHAQFGWYGPQRGDGEAALSRPDQQAKIVAATQALIDRVAEAGP